MTTARLLMVSLACCTMELGARPAWAFENGDCGSFAPDWNAPVGSVIGVISKGGPIKTVLNAVNETMTHTIFPTVPGWGTHSTSLRPSSQNSCSVPVKSADLRSGYPGFSQSDVAGMHGFLSTAAQAFYQAPEEDLEWGDVSADELANDINDAAVVADWLWNRPPFQWAANTPKKYALCYLSSDTYCPINAYPTGIYLLGTQNGSGAFSRMGYGFHQYMSGTSRVVGFDPAGNDQGIVCSQVAAYAFYKASDNGYAVSDRDPSWASYQYGKEETVNAGVALWNSIHDQCMNGLDDALSIFFAPIVTGCTRSTLCRRAAWQVVNCFAFGGNCNDAGNGNWDAYVNDPNAAGAVSLSPDRLLGWGRHPSSGNVSMYARYVGPDVQWSGDPTFGCWY